MELLYVWINYSKRGIFQQQGINLSSEFNFIFEQGQHDEKWILSEDKKWLKRESIFKNNVIENVTAVVGKNGSGKTTLLDYLSGLDCFIPNRDSYDLGYEKLREKEIRESLCVLILRDNDVITIYHDFKEGIINRTAYTVRDMSEPEKYRECLLSQTEFKDIFKVYISNSSYGGNQKDVISSQGKLDEVALTPAGISTIANTFYKKILNLDQTMYRPSHYHEWREIVKTYRKPSDFQQVCDVLYFWKLMKEMRLESYTGNVSTTLSVSCIVAFRILENKYPQFHEQDPNISEKLKPFHEYYTLILQVHQNFDSNSNIIIKNLIINLMLEICLKEHLLFPINIISLQEAQDWIRENINESEDRVYFKEAQTEIEELNRLLETTEEQNNVVPRSDKAYDSSLIFDNEKNPIAYQAFLHFIYVRFHAKHSIVLRYIIIGNLHMSSGERAFQNFFSWMNLLPQFNYISNGIPKEMRNTILLLIDEIDLYLHPEWQKKFINLLIEELKEQFFEYKVQIVFATHSPLCLSDVPKENTIYLSGLHGKCLVDMREEHNQTFGKDLYSLLNDAFFLENSTMGLYAKQYIDSIIAEMLDKDNKTYKMLSIDEAKELSNKIMYIGNEILKIKLQSMLQKCLKEKESKINLLMYYKEQLDKQIAELEE